VRNRKRKKTVAGSGEAKTAIGEILLLIESANELAVKPDLSNRKIPSCKK
jgi:hypothetical protein